MTTNMNTRPITNKYGAIEVNGLEDAQSVIDSLTGTVYWTDPNLARVFRLRLLTDRGFPFFDVSYVYGTLKNGDNVRVSVPFYQLGKRSWKREIIEHAKREGVYAKGLGILDDDVMSTVY